MAQRQSLQQVPTPYVRRYNYCFYFFSLVSLAKTNDEVYAFFIDIFPLKVVLAVACSYVWMPGANSYGIPKLGYL